MRKSMVWVMGCGIGLGGIGSSACNQDDPSPGDGSTGTSDTTPVAEAGSRDESTGRDPSSSSSSTDIDASADGSSGPPSNTSSADETTIGADTTGGEPLSFVAVTFNTGGHADGQADVADEQYGNGLSWIPAVEQTAAFFADLQPDIVVFQELFYSPDCADIPPQHHAGYVCEAWQPGDPTVVEVIMGAGYQIACHLGKTDKCAAVKTSFGTFAGCDDALCLEGLDGAPVPDCGSGSRIGRGTIDLAAGGTLTIVNVHGTSGFLPADQLCRVAQIDQIFIDLDGAPAANGAMNLVLGDYNTDPGRATLLDLSAARWNDFVGDGLAFHFITDVGPDVTPTYAGIFNIDHMTSDTFVGECWHPGITAGTDPVVDFEYFDHVPAVCSLSVRP